MPVVVVVVLTAWQVQLREAVAQVVAVLAAL
jgi:hypothetical protein